MRGFPESPLTRAQADKIIKTLKLILNFQIGETEAAFEVSRRRLTRLEDQFKRQKELALKIWD